MSVAGARPPRVSVVVLNYNGAGVLSACLESVRRQTGVAAEVIVVDNASRDGSAEAAADAFPEFTWVRLPRNLGFCAGNNEGVRRARGVYVALVNHDTVLPPDCLSGLAAALDRHPDAWVAAPRIHNRNLDMDRFPLGGTLGVNGLIIQNVFADPRRIFGAPGAALMFRRAEVGAPFDPDYRFFHEDVYLSWRAWLTGHRVIAVPELVVEHVGSAAFAQEPPRHLWLWERNRWLNLLTFFSAWTLWRLAPLFILSLWSESAADLVSGRGWGFRLRAWAWLLLHPGRLAAKRRARQAERRVPDRDLLGLWSCRLTNQTNPGARLLNALACGWCRLAGLRTWELRPDRDARAGRRA